MIRAAKRSSGCTTRFSDSPLADQIDAGAGQEYRDLEAGRYATIGNGEGDGRQFVIGSLRYDHDEVAGGLCHDLLSLLPDGVPERLDRQAQCRPPFPTINRLRMAGKNVRFHDTGRGDAG